jgi:hypothetical protein
MELLRGSRPRHKCLAGTLQPSPTEQVSEGEGRVPGTLAKGRQRARNPLFLDSYEVGAEAKKNLRPRVTERGVSPALGSLSLSTSHPIPVATRSHGPAFPFRGSLLDYATNLIALNSGSRRHTQIVGDLAAQLIGTFLAFAKGAFAFPERDGDCVAGLTVDQQISAFEAGHLLQGLLR